MENKIQNAFDSIKADSGLKETTKELLSSKRRKEDRGCRRMRIQKTIAAVCGMLLLVTGIGGFWWMQTPVSYVSIDVNPSVELALNRFDRVVSAKAYNPEGEEILRELSLKGKKYIEAIDAVVESRVMKRYLTRQAEIVFTVAADGYRENEIEKGVSHCQGHISQSSHSLVTDLKTAAQAHVQGLLSQYDSTVTVEECRHMSMGEIHGKIKEHEGNGGRCQQTEQENSDKGDGEGTSGSSGHGSHHSEGHHK